MATNPYGLSAQDLEDLRVVHSALKQKGDPRAAKVEQLLGAPAAPTAPQVGTPDDPYIAQRRAHVYPDSLAKGVAKGAASTGLNLTGIMAKLLGTDPTGTVPALRREVATPKPEDMGERLGFGAEQAAEFMAPGGAVRKVAGLASRAGRVPGFAARVAGEAAGAGGVATAQGQSRRGVGTAAAFGAATPVAAAVLPAAGRLGNRLYQSALKPSGSAAEVADKVATGLAEGIPVADSGVGKLRRLVDDLNQKIDATIASRPVAIHPDRVAQRVDDVAATFEKQVTPKSDLAVIDTAKQEFLDQFSRGRTITGTAAQEIKKGTYRQLRGKYGELSAARVESEKALARGLREELVTEFPELAALNKREGALLALEDDLERAVRRIGNSEPLTIPGVMKSLASPGIRSRLGIYLKRATESRITSGLARIARNATMAQGERKP